MGKMNEQQRIEATRFKEATVENMKVAEAEKAIRQSTEPKDVKRVAAYDKRQSKAAAAIDRDGAWTDDDEYWDDDWCYDWNSSWPEELDHDTWDESAGGAESRAPRVALGFARHTQRACKLI